ncbi:glycosyltransferase family 9 protein [Thermodesulfobacteriota bacterium]
MIIRLGALGDTLMLMPSITLLRTSTDVILVGRSPGIDFLEPYVSRCFDFEREGWHQLFAASPDMDQLPVLSGVDHAVAFLNDPEKIVHQNLRTYLQGSNVHIFPSAPSREDKTHVALYLAQALHESGVNINPLESLEAANRAPMFEKKSLFGAPGHMIFHPGSGGKGKNHSPQFWIDLIRALRKRFDDPADSLQVLIGPAEKSLHSVFKRNLEQGEAEFICSPNRDKLLSLLTVAGLFFGHDSGITHLAAMLGTPTIALFKSSSTEQWAPLGPMVKIIESRYENQELMKRIILEAEAMRKF